jgi:predicted  nucleic acid-binding Zn-ribbon protein
VNNNHNEFNQTVPVTTSDADQKNEKSPAAILEEKLRELTNKIAAAEQSLDKIKSGKKDDDSKAVSGQSNDEMAKTLEAQIKQLRSELAAAKSKAPTIVEKAEPAIARNIASVPTSSISSTRESGDDRRNYANDPVGKRETSRESTRGFGESGTSTTSASTSAAANSIQGRWT